MLIKEKKGNLKDIEVSGREVDRLPVEWYETGKRILHKKTVSGRAVVLKFMNESPNLSQDDVLYEDEQVLIIVDIRPCEAMVVFPASMYEMAKLCYEIGNKHLPLFFENDAILIPYDAPLLKWLLAAGFSPLKEVRRLLYPLRTTVAAHAHTDSGNSLFSKILKLTTSSND